MGVFTNFKTNLENSVNTKLNKFYKKADEASAFVPGINRLTSYAKGEKVKTYCCASKTDNGTVLTSKHVGNKCVPSDSGICVPQTFRCFNDQPNTLKNDSITTENNDNNASKCRYIPNAVNRVLKPISEDHEHTIDISLDTFFFNHIPMCERSEHHTESDKRNPLEIV